MKFLLLRNEKTVSEVADKIYRKLSAKARKQVEASLLKANPELKKIKSLRKGYMIRVPTANGIEKNNQRKLVNPVEDIAHEVVDSVKQFEDTITQKFARFDLKQKHSQKVLKSAGKELKKQPAGEAALKQLSKHLTDSKKLKEGNKKLVFEALGKLQKTAAGFKI